MRLESFHTARYQLDIELGDCVGRITLKDTYTGVAFADGEYRYSAVVEQNGKIFLLDGLYNPVLREDITERGGKVVIIEGRLGASNSFMVWHQLYVPEDEDFLEEKITLHNLNDDDLILRSYRFGFRKRLEKPEIYGGPGIDIENYRLIALPFRLQPDGNKHDYSLDSIYNGWYQQSASDHPSLPREEVVDLGMARSEGWAWSDGENGLLIIKYNPDSIEYSMLETEYYKDTAYLNFGGASPALYNEPSEADVLEAKKQITFGLTRYHFYEGLWRRGSYMFREYMSSLGHGLPDNYNPPIHWNELYDTGWHQNSRETYTLNALRKEAEKARDIGCEALFLGHGWEVCEGSTAWDEERLGDVRSFVNIMKEEYGLKVGFRTVGRSYCDDYPGMYRQSFDGKIGYSKPYSLKPFYEPCICSEQYQQEKLKRILDIADAGMDFIMFDEFDWRGPCFDPTHGHPVPTTPNMHAEAVMELVRGVHKKHPEILIEAHDSVWPWGVRYLPVYYLHDGQGSFDEAWAFGFVWNPLENLLSGRAISLFYYNLAYDLPLYNHINMEHDNDNCLAFWWYASTVRHLGIGGKKNNEKRFQAYKKALAEYKSLKDLYTLGDFYGIDELTHIHVISEENRCVINAFNLTDSPISREIEIRLNDLGIIGNVKISGAPHEIIKGKLVLKLDIPPFSPMLVKMEPE